MTFIKELFRHIKEDEPFGMAAQCAYYFLLSFFPFLLFLVSLLGYLPVTTQSVLELARQYIPKGVEPGVREQLQHIFEVRRGGALSFGILFTLVSSSTALNAIVLNVNKAYGLPARKSFIHSQLLAIGLTMALLLVVVFVLLFSVFGQTIGDWLFQWHFLSGDQVSLWNGLRWVVAFVVLFLVFTGVYFVAPNTCLTCKDVLPGALFAALGWQVASFGFSFYVSHWGRYNVTYGSLAGIIVLLVWFYISALLILIGGEINAITYGRRKNA
ncbi:YihY/virulence factor BrkB family protein [Paenibacillus aurantius]|uniref:YihY/virulence factor BrkB family protein n=1 Tax=Paenibacillus aurantius TaxID=2918900 RepID=A0AA96LH93_9BACL|nr:YihY/virulence factor BrkB family protein [Paenibacillus aurantius]WNQ13821.1 YihY/virulence factor BrkB family protein [Paenibacillus aurantius]